MQETISEQTSKNASLWFNSSSFFAQKKCYYLKDTLLSDPQIGYLIKNEIIRFHKIDSEFERTFLTESQNLTAVFVDVFKCRLKYM